MPQLHFDEIGINFLSILWQELIKFLKSLHWKMETKKKIVDWYLNFMIVCLHLPKECEVKLSPDTWSLLNNKDEDYSLTKSSLCRDNGFICYKVKNSVFQDKHIIQSKWTLWCLNSMWNFKMTSVICKMFNNGSWVNNDRSTNNRGRLFYHFSIIQPSPKCNEITMELFWINIFPQILCFNTITYLFSIMA